MRLKEIRRPSKLLRYRLLAFLAVFGPGFITANVDNDPGGILTYSQAGARCGYALLWTLIPTTIALIVVQEMAARMGAVTGKGLHDLVRKKCDLLVRIPMAGEVASLIVSVAGGIVMYEVARQRRAAAAGTAGAPSKKKGRK